MSDDYWLCNYAPPGYIATFESSLEILQLFIAIDLICVRFTFPKVIS